MWARTGASLSQEPADRKLPGFETARQQFTYKAQKTFGHGSTGIHPGSSQRSNHGTVSPG